MDNNDIMRRVRYIFDYSDVKMVALFGLAGHEVTREQISDWLKKDDDPSYKECSDKELAIFLNGFINERRGKKEGPHSEPESRLTNNIVFKKLKIAMNFTADDVLDMMTLAEFAMGKPELSALFRKPGHKNYRECKNQILRNFLNGMLIKYRVN